MAEKLGSGHAREMFDRGFREVGGTLYGESNVAQPMYPNRGGYEPPKENESPAMEAEQGSVLEERLAQAKENRDDRGRDDKGMDRDI